jgi:glucan phosphorylase
MNKMAFPKWCAIAACLLFAFGCSKKESAGPEATAADAARPAGKDDAALAQNFDAIQKDVTSREFERAAASMLQMQQMAPMLSEKDAARYQAQMRNVQGSIAQAAANGDAKAQNAAAMLRMMSPENQMPMRRR